MRGLPVSVPNPVEWQYVRTDLDSLSCLRRGAEVFRAAAHAETYSEQRRRALEAWQLACLANDPTRQPVAQALCRSLLDEDPTHPFAIIWALARGYEFNSERSERALKELIIDAKAGSEHVLALAANLLSGNHVGKARRLLENERASFGNGDGEQLWRHWYSQILSVEGSSAKALEVLDKSPTPD